MRTSTRPRLGGCAQLSLTWGLACPVGVGWVGPGLGVDPAGLLVRALGKYLYPVNGFLLLFFSNFVPKMHRF